ncbi:MAG: hypothetical protein HW405_570 [Candidatus Berkelbacteria bacterium]|nr:hypothetical protein [Candidatus Berkelbacteria bacterium]
MVLAAVIIVMGLLAFVIGAIWKGNQISGEEEKTTKKVDTSADDVYGRGRNSYYG